MKIGTWLAMVLTVLFFALPPALAHDPTIYIPFPWGALGGTKTPNWRFMSDAPAGALRARVRDGVAQWNQLNQTFTFGSEQGDVGWWLASLTPCDSWVSRNAVGFHNIDGAGLVRAVTTRCLNQTGPRTGEMKKFAVEFDSSENWYMGTGDATGTQVDAWSIASHEMGHAAGWGPHLPGSESICADNSGQNTMCPTYFTATERTRTLELHDIHAFQSAY